MNEAPNDITLEHSGERMVPGVSGNEVFWEHVCRYRYAAKFVAGRDVVDIACGEGYGTAALLKAGARSVIGIDVAPEVVEHAKRKYGIDARCGAAEAIPLADASFDVVVSFETIEHVNIPDKFIDECARILRPSGLLIMSTPNSDVYHRGLPKNPFHVSEMSLGEFRATLARKFDRVLLLGQQSPAPWYLQWRGFGRLTQVVRRLIARRDASAVQKPSVSAIVSRCSRPPGPADWLLWPDTVRRLPPGQLRRCTYLVAIAANGGGPERRRL